MISDFRGRTENDRYWYGMKQLDFLRGANRRVVHPSYQAWSYAQLIRDYNATVQDRKVKLSPCACLHNYIRHESDPLDAEQYRDYYLEAPAYTKGQLPELREFIKKSICK